MKAKKKRRPSFEARLPGGGYTTSRKEYVKAWYSILEPLKEKLNLGSIGFDPGFLLYDKENERVSVDIPVWLAKRILGLMELP